MPRPIVVGLPTNSREKATFAAHKITHRTGPVADDTFYFDFRIFGSVFLIVCLSGIITRTCTDWPTQFSRFLAMFQAFQQRSTSAPLERSPFRAGKVINITKK